jgi:hypothetical protein
LTFAPAKRRAQRNEEKDLSMKSDPELQLLKKIAEIKGFCQAALQEDKLEDWNLARDLGEFLIRIGPDEAIGHALVARASRHLGDVDRAREALQHCRLAPMGPREAEVLIPLLAEEEQHLSATGPAGEQR